MIAAIKYLFYTELLLSLRRSQEWLYPLGFFIIVISLFPLAFTSDPAFLKKYFPGCIWIAALLASLLSLENLFLREIDDGSLDQVLLSSLSPTIVFTIKIVTKWLVTELPLIISTPLLAFLFHLNLYPTLTLCISLLLGTPILILLGCFGAALTIGLKQQGVLLGFLILPLSTPVLIFGVTIVQYSQMGVPMIGAVAFLAGLCLLAITLLPLTISATLRIGLDDAG
jgi:heme exporter protein B